MAKEIKLLIREDLVTKSGKARIEFLIYFEGKQYRVPTGKSIEPKYWIQNSELVDKRSEDSVKINSYLSERKQEFEKYKRKKEALEESVSLEEMKRILKGLPLDEVKIMENKLVYPTISKAFDDYVKFKELKPGSKNNYRIAKNVLVDFSKVKYRKELTIEQIDYKFVVQFVKYLREERPIPRSAKHGSQEAKVAKNGSSFL